MFLLRHSDNIFLIVLKLPLLACHSNTIFSPRLCFYMKFITTIKCHKMWNLCWWLSLTITSNLSNMMMMPGFIFETQRLVSYVKVSVSIIWWYTHGSITWDFTKVSSSHVEIFLLLICFFFSSKIRHWLHECLPWHEPSVPHQPGAAGSDRRPVWQHLHVGPQICLHRMLPACCSGLWIRSLGWDGVKVSAPTVLMDISIIYLKQKNRNLDVI